MAEQRHVYIGPIDTCFIVVVVVVHADCSVTDSLRQAYVTS